MFGWKRHEGKIQGKHVSGDKKQPPTRWYNHLWLARKGWRLVAVFEVSEEVATQGYHVGYLPFDGNAMVETSVSHERRFRMKLGHEDCTFFATSKDGAEVELKHITTTVLDDAAHTGARLH